MLTVCIVVSEELVVELERLVAFPHSIVEFAISSVVQEIVADMFDVAFETELMTGAVVSLKVNGSQSITAVVVFVKLYGLSQIPKGRAMSVQFSL